MSIYNDFVSPSQLTSPINGYTCRRINKQNIKNFGFDSIEELHKSYPDFPLVCEEVREKLLSTRNNKTRQQYYQTVIEKNKQNKIYELSLLEKDYKNNIKSCPKCNSEIPFLKRNNKFCSRKCANSKTQTAEMNASRSKKLKLPSNPKQKKIRTTKHKKIKICPVYGFEITDMKQYSTLKWAAYPAGRIRTIKLLANAFNIELGNPDTPGKLDNAVNVLEFDYHSLKLSSLDIHSKYGFLCSASNVSNLLKTLGIERRSLSEASTEALLQGKGKLGEGGENRYKTGYHMSWNNKKHYYRSSYELNFFILLDENKIHYEVESLRIEYFDTVKKKKRIAIPDVIVNNTIYEVKGSYTFNEQNMIDKYMYYDQIGYKLVMVYEHQIHNINSINDLLTLRERSIKEKTQFIL